jgi:hypothetical protein
MTRVKVFDTCACSGDLDAVWSVAHSVALKWRVRRRTWSTRTHATPVQLLRAPRVGDNVARLAELSLGAFVKTRAGMVLLTALVSAGCGRTFGAPPADPGAALGAIDGTLSTGARSELLRGNDVTLFLPDGTRAHATTDAHGAFSFLGLLAGTYTLQASVQPAPGGAVLFAEKTVPSVVVRAHETTHLGILSPASLINVPGAGQIHLVGRVTADLHPDGGGLVNPDAGAELGGTQVAIFFAGDATAPVAVTVAGSDGTFGQELLPGTYDLRATNPLFVPGSLLGVAVGLDGGSGTQTLSQTLVLAINPARLSGTVQLELNADLVDAGSGDGGPFTPGAGVAVGTVSGGAGLSDPSGSYVVSNLLGKPDRVFFAAPADAFGQRYHDALAMHDIALVPGATTDLGPVALQLDRGTITGAVKMADGSPAENIVVSVTGTHLVGLTVRDPVDPSRGRYTLSGVPARLGYEVRIHRDHYQDALAEAVDVASDGSTTAVALKTLIRLSGDLAVASTDTRSVSGYTDAREVFVKLDNPTAADIAQVRIAPRADLTVDDGGLAPWRNYPPLDDGGAPEPRGYRYTLADSEGLNTVYAQFQNSAQVPSEVFSAAVVLDRVRPVNGAVALSSGARFTAINQSPSLVLGAADLAVAPAVASGLSAMVLGLGAPAAGDLDGGLLPGLAQPFSAYATLATPLLPDGPVDAYAQFIDNAGNASAVAHASFVVDTVAPRGGLTLVGPAVSDPGFTNTPLVQITERFGLDDGGFDSAPHEPSGGYVTVRLANESQASLDTATPLPASAVQSWFLDTASGSSTKTVWMRLVDAAGNTSRDYSATVVLNQRPPSGSAQLAGWTGSGGAKSRTPNVTLSYTLSADTTGIAVSEQPTACAQLPLGAYQVPAGAPPTVAVTLSAGDGPKTLYSCLRNAAGNTYQLATSVLLDTQAPIANVVVGSGAHFQNVSGNVPVVFSAFSPDLAGVALSTSSLSCATASYLPFSASNPVGTVNVGSTAATDGAYTVFACLQDAAGNTTTLPGVALVKDTIAPNVTAASFTSLSNAAASATNQASTGVTFSGFSEPVVAYRFSTDASFANVPFISFASDGSAVSGAQSVAYVLPSGDGVKTIYMQVLDRAANPSATATLPPVVLKRTSPTASVDVLAGGLVNPPSTNQSAVTLRFAVSADATDAAVSSAPLSCSQLASGAYQPLVGTPPTLPFTLLGPGVPSTAQFIYGCVRDIAGNAVSTVNGIALDLNAPTGSFTVGNGQPIQTGSTFAVTLVGVSADATRMIVVADNAPACGTLAGYVALATSTNLNLPDGAHTIYVCLADAAGNTSALPSVSLLVDNVAPTLAAVSFSGLSNAGAGITSNAAVTVVLTGIADATSGVNAVRLSSDPSFAGVAFGPASSTGAVVSGTLNLPSTLSSGSGTKTLYAQVRDRAGNVSAAAQASVVLDTQAPVFTSAPSPARLYTNSSTVNITASGSDNLDTPGQLQIGYSTSLGCAGVTYQPYGTGTVAVGPLSTGANRLLGCLMDRAGNVTPAPSSVTVYLDTVPPSASNLVPNPPVALASGALVSWADANSGTEHIEVDASQDPTFATGVMTNRAAVGACTASGITPPPSAVRVGLSPGDTLLTNLANWYFRIRAVDCAGNVSGNVAVPGSAVPNLGSAPLINPLTSGNELITDGPDLWIHTPADSYSAGSSNGVRQEVLMHCKGGSQDCRNNANWSSVAVAIDTSAQALPAPSSTRPAAAMVVTDDTLYLVDMVQDATHGNAALPRKLAMAYCDRSTNCDAASNWVPNNLVREFGTANTGYSPRGAASGSAIGLFYVYAQSAFGSATYLSMTRCDRALGSLCRVSGNWTQLDTPIVMDPAAPISVAGTDDFFYVGGVSAGPYGATVDARGESMLVRCEGSCSNPGSPAAGCTGFNCGCDGYRCSATGDFRFSRFSSPPAGQLISATTPKMVASAGNVFAAWSERTGPAGGPFTDAVKGGFCGSGGNCYGFDFGVATLSSKPAPPNATLSTPRPELTLAASGGSQGPSVILRLAYSDLSGPSLVLRSCDATVASNCASSANWSQTTLASGPGTDLTVEGGTIGRNLYLLGHSPVGDPLLYQPIVATPLDFYASPQPQQVVTNWSPLQSSTSSVVTYGAPGSFPASAARVSINDPSVATFTLGVSAAPQRTTLTALGAAGVGDPSQSWTVTPFSVLGAPRSDLQPSMALSIGSPGVAATASDTFLYVTYLSGTQGLALGRCDTLGDCANPASWSWGQANVNTAWNTNQLTVDYPRGFPAGGRNVTTASTPRLFTGGRWNGSSFYIEGCLLNGAGTCTTAASFANNQFDGVNGLPPMAATAQPTLRAAGDLVESVESDGAQKVIVRYCDGSHTYPHNPCGSSGATDRPINYCFSASNWKGVTLDGAPYGASSGAYQLAGTPRPDYGFMAVQPRAAGGFIFWSCAAAKFVGGGCAVELAQNDCSLATNWKANVVQTGSTEARYLDMTFSSDNYFPTTQVNDSSAGVYVSYFDTTAGQWGVAECRGNPDSQYYAAWSCTQPGAPISGSASAALGWSFAPVLNGSAGHAVASTVRVVNGDVVASFFEDNRIYLAGCTGGINCHRHGGWHPYTVTGNVNTDHSAGTANPVASWGYLAGGARNDLYLAFPNLSGSTRTVNLFTGGAISAP